MMKVRKFCSVCGGNNGNREVSDYEYPMQLEMYKIVVTKELIVNLINATNTYNVDYSNGVDYDVAIEKRNKFVESQVFNSFQKVIWYDNTKQSIDTVLTHLVFDIFLGIKQKCQGCVVRLKSKIFKNDSLKTIDDIDLICTEYTKDILEKLAKQNIKSKGNK